MRAKLVAAWTSFMFLCAYVDIIAFFKPGVVDGILAGKVCRANCITNLIVASVQIPYVAFNVVGESWTFLTVKPFAPSSEHEPKTSAVLFGAIRLGAAVWACWRWDAHSSGRPCRC